MYKKVVLVTGGSRGIGKAIVETLAQNEYMTIFTYNTSYKSAIELEERYKYVKAYQCDISDYNRVVEVSKEILDSYKRVDILVNNAGIVKDKVFTKMDKETWDYVIDVNLKAIYNFTYQLLPGMIENNWGRIINISSIIGQKGGFGQTNYSAAKAGIIGFTKSLAIEVAKSGVTVNAIAPGIIDTDMIKNIPTSHVDRIKESIPVKKIGKPEDVANIASCLVGDQSYYITGQVINVNGGVY